MTERIKPALTAEEWAFVESDPDWAGYIDEFVPNSHAAAAIHLYGQPFGFTWEDVEELRHLADCSDAEWGDGEGSAVRDIADRVAALLPPREGGEG